MWHPYYAGYSESFVLSVLKSEKLAQGAVILDPWMGSGTTGLVCQKENINCIGADINPIMSRFAAAKSHSIIAKLNDEGLPILERVIIKCKASSQLSKYYIETLGVEMSYFRLLIKIIDETLPDKEHDFEMDSLKSFYYSVVYFTFRRLLDIKSGSNPTWVVNNGFKAGLILDDILSALRCDFSLMLAQLTNYFNGVSVRSRYKVLNCDCKKLPIENNSIDMIVTSPPYLTRIDYAASTKFELQMSFGLDGYQQVRKNSMGTTTVPKIADPFNALWGGICLKVLEQVASHNSRASDTYYIKNKLRYFSDTFSAMSEIYRVLRDGCSAYLVIQNSYYKEIEIPLYDIYCEMAGNIGFSVCDVIREEKVRASFGKINPKSSLYLKDKVYYEKIIRVTK
ncbi:hypothetical protein FOC33_01470 [Plesiomonas shigelloides]|uniref:DNA methyltransferase n=1 Tax=Plesiomonas shigelloides TaxID=703 RepID=UPI00143ECDBC|nr:DNA methyltransferase [Plesiomonas shigelloides]QIY07723.1 hypothetical protein FOC33_01470 [Plesiomonas shigelloides]